MNNSSNIYGQLAIQGPKARHLVNEHTDVDVSDMSMFEFKQDVKFLIKISFFHNQAIQGKMVSKSIVNLKTQ